MCVCVCYLATGPAAFAMVVAGSLRSLLVLLWRFCDHGQRR